MMKKLTYNQQLDLLGVTTNRSVRPATWSYLGKTITRPQVSQFWQTLKREFNLCPGMLPGFRVVEIADDMSSDAVLALQRWLDDTKNFPVGVNLCGAVPMDETQLAEDIGLCYNDRVYMGLLKTGKVAILIKIEKKHISL